MRKTEEEETPRVGSHPMSETLKNTLIAELICTISRVGNTDVCPGRQTPSRRHWVNLSLFVRAVQPYNSDGS